MPPPRHCRVLRVLALLGVLFPVARPGVSQDNHYWDRAYGTTSELLGGTVVGDVRDLSATFYNPGAFALADDPRFLLSLETVELSRIQFPREAGDTLNLAQTNLATGPGMLAGTFNGPKAKNRLAYSAITRHRFDLQLRQRTSDPFDPAPAEPLTAQFIDRKQRLTEVWVGVTWARKLARQLGFGATGYVATRGQSADAQFTAQTIGPPVDQASAINLRGEYSYLHFRLLAKLGLAWEVGAWRLGVSATTPSLSIWGRGELGGNTSLVNVDLDGDGTPDNFLADNFQRPSPSYKSPGSAAVGVTYGRGRTQLHGTVEWFDGVSLYSVMEGQPFDAQSGGTPFIPGVKEELRSVVNGGLGIEHRFSPEVAGYGSVTFDQSSKVREQGRSNTFATWNVVHLRGGSTFAALGADVALGLGFSFGSKEVPSLVDLVSDPIPPLPEDSINPRVRFWRLKLILGFTTGRSR